jgi:hypothetical protein
MKKYLFLAVMLMIAGHAGAESIALSPASHELGEINRGSSKQVTVYVDAIGYDEPFRIEPEYDQPRTSSIMQEGSEIDRSQYSAQDISSWITFSQDSYTIDPNGTMEANGRTYDGQITYTINVPRSGSEPGYHAGSINPTIIRTEDASGFSASSIGLAVYSFNFKVPGTAYRELQYNPRVIRTGTDQLTIVNRIVNQGTVTATVSETSFELQNMNGNLTASRSINSVKVPEGGSETVVTTINSEEVEAGNYRIEGTANFITGRATASDTFSLSDIVEVEPSELEETSGPTGNFDNQSLPLWLVVMILVVFGVLMYSFGIEPVWILAAVGIVGISLYILFSSVPNIMLLVLLTVSGGLIYYGAM